MNDLATTINEDKAIACFEGDKMDASEKQFLEILRTHPNNITAHFYLVCIYRRLKKIDKALQHSRCLLKLSPHERNAYLNLANVYADAGNIRQAIVNYKKELKQNAFSGESMFNLGFLYFERHQWKKASVWLSQYYHMGFPFERKETIYTLGFCYMKLNDVQAYINLYQQYSDATPTAGWAIANLGYAFFYIKDYRKAILKLTQAKTLGVNVDKMLNQAKKMYGCSRSR